MDKKKTGELIREARTKKNYTQTELGDLIGVTNKAVSRWENGESFPDIGILENLSKVLEIKIQDIVVGEVQADDETALTEVVRLAKLQKILSRKRVIQFVIGSLILLYSAVIGYCGLGSDSMIGDASGAVYLISLGVVLLVMGYKSVSEKESLLPTSDKVRKVLLIVSSVSGIWIILVTGIIIVMTGKGITPFYMKEASVGPFLGCQLSVAFLVNFAIAVISFYGIMTGRSGIDLGAFISVAVLYLTALYGDILHRLTTLEAARQMFVFGTMMVIVEVGICIIAVIVLKSIEPFGYGEL